MSISTTDMTCRGCSLLCDDLTVSIDRQKLLQCENGCPEAEKWIQSSLTAESTGNLQQTHKNLKTAKNWIQQAGSPLICGLEGIVLEAETLLVELAKKEQALLSAGTSAEKITTYQRYGGANCSLGEVRQRADLVLVSNCDLLTIWPRFEQKILSPPGRFLPPEKPRQLIFLGDASKLQEPSRYSEIIDLPEDQLPQALLILRRAIQKQSVPASKSDDEPEIEMTTQLQKLAEKLLAAWYPVLFHDTSCPQTGALWTKLVSEVNQRSRMHSLNVTAGRAKGTPSETILAMTGFPDHIAFHSEQCGNTEEISHDCHRYQAARLINQQETDLVIFAGDQVSEKWIQTLQKLTPPARLIVIHSGATKLPQMEVPVLEIHTQMPGIHEAGTALRCDGIPLPLRSVASSQLPTMIDAVKFLMEPSTS